MKSLKSKLKLQVPVDGPKTESSIISEHQGYDERESRLSLPVQRQRQYQYQHQHQQESFAPHAVYVIASQVSIIQTR